MSLQGTSLNPDDLALAAEYAMGLLDDPEEARAETRLATEPEFAAAVESWRARLSPFDASVEASPPSPELWSRIADTIKPEAVIPLPGARAAVRGATLWESLAFWRIAGISGAFATLVFAIVAIGALATSKQLRNDLVALAQRKPVYVAVLVNDATKETGAVVNAFANGRVEVIPLRPINVPAGRTLQVWTLWDRAVGPKSLGISSQSRTLQLDLGDLPDTVSDQLFEITLEPEGGSPIGRPTGPILFKGNAARAL